MARAGTELSSKLTVQLQNQLYSSAHVRALDGAAIKECGIPGIALMKRAAKAMLSEMQARWPAVSRPIVFCGGGNNGGDGYLFAALAAQNKLSPIVVSVRDPAKLSGDARRAWKFACAANVTMVTPEQYCLADADLIVDAMLGTGLRAQVRPATASIIEQVNASALPVLAADLPSGLNSDTGAVMGAAVEACCTVSFVALKTGLFTASGRAYCGDVVFSRLDIPDRAYQGIEPDAVIIDLADMHAALPVRTADSHKGRHGHVLVIGGDHGMGGAGILAARAALYAGAGLVSLATRGEHLSAALAQQAELMVHAVHSGADCRALIEKSSCVVIGPGLGSDSWGQELLHSTLVAITELNAAGASKTVILDADALNIIAAQLPMLNMLNDLTAVYTPHPGEAARLLGVSSSEVQQDRYAALQSLQAKLPGTILLKGSGTLCSRVHQPPGVCVHGNAGMAVGGMGDVLSGVIAAQVGLTQDVEQAVALSVCLHSAAADLAVQHGAGPIGLVASDLLRPLRDLINNTELAAGRGQQ